MMNGVASGLLSLSGFVFLSISAAAPACVPPTWRLECDLWPWPLIPALLMTVVNWWKAKGRAFLCSVVICCVSPRRVELVQR